MSREPVGFGSWTNMCHDLMSKKIFPRIRGMIGGVAFARPKCFRNMCIYVELRDMRRIANVYGSHGLDDVVIVKIYPCN